MENKGDFSPRKAVQIEVLLSGTPLKQREIAQKREVRHILLVLSKKKSVAVLKWVKNGSEDMDENKKTVWRTDRQIVKKVLKNKRAAWRNISAQLHEHCISHSTRRVNQRLLERNLWAYRPGAAFAPVNNEEVIFWLWRKPTMTFTA